MAVSAGVPPTFGKSSPLFRLRLSADVEGRRPYIGHYDVARDGRFLAAVVESEGQPAALPVAVHVNATAALRRSGGK